VRRDLTAGWSSGLRPRLRNRRSRFQIPVVSRGFCDEQLHLLMSHGCLYTYIIINITHMYDLCMFIRYLVSITQVLKDTYFGLDNWCECGNVLILLLVFRCLCRYINTKNCVCNNARAYHKS
jgi:hypothetical protein